MANRPKLDFAEIKSRVSLEQVMQMLDLRLKRSGNQYRGSCPVHGGGDRTLVVTPTEGFFCFAEKKGGDQIALYAHVQSCNNYDAAAALQQHFRIAAPEKPVPEKTAKTTGNSGELEPLTYLQHEHEILDLLGLPPAVCKALGAGFAAKGLMLNRIAIPLRLENGKLIGYLGVATKPDQVPLLKFPSNLEEMIGEEPELQAEEPEKRSTDEMRHLLRVV
jgi:CHC2 zinc finger